MHLSDLNLVHSASPSPDLRVPKPEDEDVMMSESEGETAATAPHAQPVPRQGSAFGSALPLPVAEAAIPAGPPSTPYDEGNEDGGYNKEDEGREEGEIHAADSPRYLVSSNPNRLSSPARPTPAPLGAAGVLPVPIPAPKVTTEHDHHELRKDISWVPDASLRGDRHHLNTPAGGRDADADSSSIHPHEELIDRTGEISVNIVAGTETATVEFLLPSDGGDSEDAPMKYKTTVTMKGPGSVSLSASWRVGS